MSKLAVCAVARAELEKAKNASLFWADWSFNASFTQAAKKKYPIAVLDTEFGRFSGVESMVEAFEISINVIRKMNDAQLV